MTREQQEAMAVISAASKYPPRDGLFLTSTHAQAIIDMLANPRIYEDVMRKLGKPVAVMPEGPTPEAIEVMRLAYLSFNGRKLGDTMEAVYRAMHKHLSKPPVRVEWDITGTDKDRRRATHTTVAAEAEIGHAVQAALSAGVECVTIVRREVVG